MLIIFIIISSIFIAVKNSYDRGIAKGRDDILQENIIRATSLKTKLVLELESIVD